MPDSSLISVVTPTLHRPKKVQELIENLVHQKYVPSELILVDGAPQRENETQRVVEQYENTLPFALRYIRHGGGTAIQRNVGIDAANGDFVAFIDDDIRLAPDYFELIVSMFNDDTEKRIGGIIGYISNQYFEFASSRRWQWYRRLKLFTTYEPGHFDFQTGYPINRYLQPPHCGQRKIDFMSSGYAVWRSDVFCQGLRFDEFFTGFGVMEDAHMSLQASQNWILLECGSARCMHLHAPEGRESERMVALKTALNHRYLFKSIVPDRTWINEFRFWRVQFIQLLIFITAALRQSNKRNWMAVYGKIEGIWKSLRLI